MTDTAPHRPLDGLVVLITGGGSGIGAEAARWMARQGARVALAGIPADGVAQVAEQIQQAGGEAIDLPTDVSDAVAVQHAVDATVDRFGQLDAVVASAGVQLHRRDHTLHQMDDAAWDQTHDVNYRGVYLTCKAALARMVEQDTGGSIVIISSVTATSGASANVAYASGKHGLIGLARHIAVHYGPRGIRCNALCPGALDQTPDFDQLPDPDAREASRLDRIPLGRLGTPADIAPWIALLVSPAGAYANGATLVIDGGMHVS
jgi:meso-butanediol dehydrogenase/(S,S)-butanediol dehydrogenase/diacetyl reductase